MKTDIRIERAFVLYRDLGPQRSFKKLAALFKERWPADAVSSTMLNNWARKHGWARAIEEYDHGRSAAVQPPSSEVSDDVVALRQAASQALATVLHATSMAAQKPGDLKILLETANRAMDMAARLEQERSVTSSTEDSAALGARLADAVVASRRRDLAFLATSVTDAACKIAQIADRKPVLEAAAAAVGLRLNSEGEIEEMDDGAREAEMNDLRAESDAGHNHDSHDLSANGDSEDREQGRIHDDRSESAVGNHVRSGSNSSNCIEQVKEQIDTNKADDIFNLLRGVVNT